MAHLENLCLYGSDDIAYTKYRADIITSEQKEQVAGHCPGAYSGLSACDTVTDEVL